MEVLDLMQPDRWSTIHEGDPLLYRAKGCLVSLFTPHEMLIAGGVVDGYMTSDVILYDFRTQGLTQADVAIEFELECCSKPFTIGVGKVVAMVVDTESDLHLVKISRQS